MSLDLFTLLCDFDGGTYVSQVRASDERDAIQQWATLLLTEQPIAGHSNQIAGVVASNPDQPVPLKGLSDVWCWTATIGDKLALTNIVRSA